MAAELPRPGVEVIQEFRTVSPSIVTPTLVPCIVGACRQIIEVLESSALNADAKVSLPVFFTAKDAALVGSTYVYTGLSGKKLYLVVDNSPIVEIEFSSNSMTPAAVAQAINTALNSAGVYGAIAETKAEYEDDGTLVEKTWTLRTVAAGELEKVEVTADTDATVWAKLGLKPGWVFSGLDVYNGSWVDIPWVAFPNPRNNLEELTVDPDSIRLFFASSASNMRELSRTSGFCRRGGVVNAYDDGNGDALTPFVDAPTENFTSTATAASLTGTATLTPVIASLVGKTLTLKGNRAAQTITLEDYTGVYPLTSSAELVTQLNAFFDDFDFSLNTDKLVITAVDKGQDSNLEVTGGTAVEILGITSTVTGTGDLTTAGWYGGGGTLDTKTFILNGTTVTFSAPADETALLAALTAAFTDFTFVNNGSDLLKITKKTAGTITIGTGTANSILGFTSSAVYSIPVVAGVAFPVQAGDELFIEGVSYGYINQVAPGAVTTRLRMTKQVAMTMHATTTGTTDLTGLTYPGDFHVPDKTVILDGTTFTFGAGTPTDETELLSLLNAFFTGFTFTSVTVGSAHYLKVEKTTGSGPFTLGGTLCTTMNLLVAGTYAPQLGENFYIIAKNLTGEATRPAPELSVSTGVPQLVHDLLRGTDGVPSTSAQSYVYMMYKALRKDVSPAAVKPGMLTFDTTTDLTDSLAPVSTENPLALGIYLAMLNCPGAQVSGLGVDEVSDDMPEGTVEGFTRAAEFLEGVEVYAIAPLTHDKTVGEVFSVHVSTMSEPENKGERICLFNSLTPTHDLDTLVASGATGNSLGENTFDTGIANLSTLLVAAGIPNPVGVIDASYGVFLDVASDGKYYSIQQVSGSVVTIRMTFTGGENDDGFYAQSPDLFPPSGVPLINETFSVKVRGDALTLPTGKPDKAGIALTLQKYAQSFMNRRFWHIFPDKCAATIEGIEQLIEGYYMCAGYAGLIAGQPPQQSFTNFPLTGFTRVLGSNDTYSEKQLNIMAAGGNWIVVQETQNSPLSARMALTTDMTSVETRTDSITKVVDFTAKIMRRGYRNFIGRFNVTQGFLDSLGHVGQGILTFLTESGVLIGGSLNNIIQDETAPDTVLIDATLDPPYPCNYIRLTLVI